MVEFKVDRHTRVPLLMEVNGRFLGIVAARSRCRTEFPFIVVSDGMRRQNQCTRYKVGVKSRWSLGDLDHLLRLFKSDAALCLRLWESHEA